jgi:hypothetical protein
VRTPGLYSKKQVTTKLVVNGLYVNHLLPPRPEDHGMPRRAAYEQANLGARCARRGEGGGGCGCKFRSSRGTQLPIGAAPAG